MYRSELFAAFVICSVLSVGHCLPARRSSWIESVGNVIEDMGKFLIFNEKCMGELGCFNNGPPYFNLKERAISLLPDDRDTIGTQFHLYTPERKNGFNFTYANPSEEKIGQAGFDPRRRTIFIVHGFMADMAPVWMEPMKDALLAIEDYNVFIVTWPGGDGPWYELSVANTRVVGAEIAQLIKFLQKNFELNPENVYIIGHSLGAHIAGYAGKRIPNLGRITGLDPAGPYFENVNSSIRLNSTDALLVDIIHSDAATNRFQGFGTTESIGDIDFWANGGSKQPGCPDMGTAIFDFLMNPDLKGPEVIELMCHHHRAIELMISSLRNKDCLFGSSCEDFNQPGKCLGCQEPKNCVKFGLEAENHAEKGVHLDLYVKTSNKLPYCLTEKTFVEKI